MDYFYYCCERFLYCIFCCYCYCCRKEQKKKKNNGYNLNDISTEIEFKSDTLRDCHKKSNKNNIKKNKKQKNKKIEMISFSENKVLKKDDNIDNKNYEILENKSEDGPILVGLNNIGATCYMNATLQCLSNTDKLTTYFLNKFPYNPNNMNKIISNAYYEVITNLWDRKNNNSSYSPDNFKLALSQENPLFAGVKANDSKDLINFLLERFHSELNVQNNVQDINYNCNENDQLDENKMLSLFINEFKRNYNSIISDLFYGLMETKSQCLRCNQIKYNFQIYSFLEFPLEKVNQYCYNTGKRNNYIMNNNKNPDINLYECFEYYGNMELMNGDNQMYCNICKCCFDSLYGSVLYTAPNNLIINLNRGRGAVYECKVNFPEILDLSNFVSFKNSNTLYELYGVICHIGPSSMSGHFVAYCKNRMDKKWYLYNDGLVTFCKNPFDYRKGMAYILFYQVVK